MSGIRTAVVVALVATAAALARAQIPAAHVAHVILAVEDNGSPTLTSYRRIVVTTQR